MKTRTFLQGAAITSASIVVSHLRANSVSLSNYITADECLKEFLEKTQRMRKLVYGDQTKVTSTMLDEAETMLRDLNETMIRPEADKGSRRHQFYCGAVYTGIYHLTGKDLYQLKGNEYFKQAEKQGHPEAMYWQIKSMPRRENNAQYVAAIKAGSVSALATCSRADVSDFVGQNWMRVGPIIHGPEYAAVEKWSEVFINWMIIYHFLIRWDRDGKYFTLDLPNEDLCNIISGKVDPDDDHKEEFSIEIMRACVKKAFDHARTMDINFYPEEIYGIVWRKLFTFLESPLGW